MPCYCRCKVRPGSTGCLRTPSCRRDAGWPRDPHCYLRLAVVHPQSRAGLEAAVGLAAGASPPDESPHLPAEPLPAAGGGDAYCDGDPRQCPLRRPPRLEHVRQCREVRQPLGRALPLAGNEVAIPSTQRAAGCAYLRGGLATSLLLATPQPVTERRRRVMLPRPIRFEMQKCWHHETLPAVVMPASFPRCHGSDMLDSSTVVP